MTWQTRLGRVEVFEQQYRKGRNGQTIRPFCQVARVSSRGYSLGLQRAVVDLAADTSFAETVNKIREHYGIEVCASQVRVITGKHGATMEDETHQAVRMPDEGVGQMIGQADGAMIPVVRIKPGRGDRRKRRSVGWREAKLSLVRVVGKQSGRYGASLGSVSEVGQLWRRTAIEAGMGANTKLHCVGDGALWIVSQVAEQFGSQASYLVDFYHVSEYLAEAGAEMVAKDQVKSWLGVQQSRLKANQVGEVLQEMKPHSESDEIADDEAVIRKCIKYLENKRNNLDYQGAIAADLPIGSGEIESGHRTVVQARLKKAGAWWKEETAKKMLALRTCRANGEWNTYWERFHQATA